MIGGKQETLCGLYLGGGVFMSAFGRPQDSATLNWELVTCGACRRSTSAIEARTVETERLDAKHESAVGEAETPNHRGPHE